MGPIVDNFPSYLRVLIAFSTFFWFWALKNTIKRNVPDLGVVSFGTVITTTSYLLALADHQIPLAQSSTILKGMVIGSHLFVSINYAGGAYLGFTIRKKPKYGWYCAIFTFLWLLLAMNVSNGMNNYLVQATS